MSGFKLLGIKTKDRVDNSKHSDAKDYLKILKENTYYPFYTNFKLSKDGKTLTRDAVGEIDIYSSKKNDLKINISAIVGKNGSGKSTLLELLYVASYNLGCNYGLLREWVPNKDEKFDHNCKPIIEGKHITCESLNLNFDILFEKNDEFYSLQFRGKAIKLVLAILREDNKFHFGTESQLKLEKKEELSQLFYSIAINYSIYGLNSKILGKWIKPLFHKNDGYKTPLVINPMRTEGNFDINEEMEFASYRLLHNLLKEKQNKKEKIFITDNQFVKKIKFKLNKKNKLSSDIKTTNYYGLTGKSQSVNLILDLQTVFFNDNLLQEVMLYKANLPFQLEISNYIVRKIKKITNTYDEYKRGYIAGGNNELFLNKLKLDGSHITFKLKQAINFLRISLEEFEGGSIWLNLKKGNNHLDFTLKELLGWMKYKEGEDLITKIPPGIFSFEIILSEKLKKSSNLRLEPTFSDLSSGEQQMIHSIQSVLYHLYNLQSVHRSNDGRLSYVNVNIIFDEIELYFHPEYQRRFISELLKSIERIDISKKEGIESLNFIFSTHSPFILSDIPANNILRLKKGKPNYFKKNEETFAANIQELLASSFFMDTVMGEFAESKINEIIDNITNKESSINKEDIISLIGDSFLKENIMQYKSQMNDKN